jgi:membrane fusion protein (multidrug efflux system)
VRDLRLPVVSILITVGIACKESPDSSLANNPNAQEQVLNVEVLVAQSQRLSADIDVPGTLLAFETTEIHPEVPGRIIELNIREGSAVRKGALLAKLNDGDLQAQLRKLEVQLKIAEQTERRQDELLKIQGISQQDYDLSLLQVRTLNADMDIIAEAIRKTEIRAPFSGRLGFKNVSPGAYVTPADVLTTIGQVDRLKIQFNVPERYSGQIKNGMEVTFNIDGSQQTYRASVMATQTGIEEATRSLAVRAVIQDRDPALIPGTFARVHLVLGQNLGALMIPNIAVIPQGRTKQIYLYKGGKALPQEITTGIRDSTSVEVIQGLNAGDTVITSSILFLRPGIEVDIDRFMSL